MIELHRLEKDEPGREIEQKLNDMVVAYCLHVYQDPHSCDDPLPHISENGSVITGKENIRKYLDNLDMELCQQRSITGDGCYIDPETGKVC